MDVELVIVDCVCGSAAEGWSLGVYQLGIEE